MLSFSLLAVVGCGSGSDSEDAADPGKGSGSGPSQATTPELSPKPGEEAVDPTVAPTVGSTPGSSGDGTVGVPEPDMSEMEPAVAEKLRQARRDVLAEPGSPEAWGRLGMVAHAHELWSDARIGYERARTLDPTDERWPYYLGDVLSVVGTDLGESADAFRKAMALRPNYAPAHMRLGRVLVADGQREAAAKEFERSLELADDLQPARVGLAQILLSQGELERSEKLLKKVLSVAPRHAQALSTLGQVYMRQGRRQEARAIAERARDAALYGLFSDPLMGDVVQEGASMVLVWERAKAFFDNGNYEQASRGLQKVIEIRPSNVEARHQLAIAYGNLGHLERSLDQLQRVVELEPDMVDARIRLATVYLDMQQSSPAAAQLRQVLQLAPDDPDAGWLLGRAILMSGDLQGALVAFGNAQAAASAGQSEVPAWARLEWGTALAQISRFREALDQFLLAIEKEPQNARALFTAGLALEGLGKTGEAVDYYCRSMKAQPNPPSMGRLQALGQSCPG